MPLHSIVSLILLSDLSHWTLKQYFDPIPLDPYLNADVISNERGIVMFHGAKYDAPDIPQFLHHVTFETADINPDVYPTHVVDFFKLNQLRALGFYKYSLDHYGPTGANPNFLVYLYHMRQITLPGGLIMFRHGFYGLDSVRYEFRDSKVPIVEVLDHYMEYLRQLIAHCGCRSFQWYNLRSQQYFISVHDTGYTVDLYPDPPDPNRYYSSISDHVYGNPIPDPDLILIVYV